MNVRCGFQRFGPEPCDRLLLWRHGESWCIAHGTRYTPYEAWDAVTEAEEPGSRHWTRWEIKTLTTLWGKSTSVEDISLYLRRSKNAIYTKAWLLGLSRRKKWPKK